MSGFPLCHSCRGEYDDPTSRRFHAQSIACPSCGPRVALWGASGEPLSAAADLLRSGGVLALKGLGGFQLLTRADSPEAVGRLRRRKARPTKPFAVMVPSLEAARALATVGPAEEALLVSPENPVVLLTRRPGACLAPEVAPRLGQVGLMLPTTPPLHHLLLRGVDFPVVATSGNAGGEPIVTDEGEARDRLRGTADAFFVHDRPITRRVDDSVARVIDGRPTLLRLARGYAPLPLPAVERWARRHLGERAPAVLAVGGHQKAALALYAGGQAVLGPHVGDLDDLCTRRAFAEAARDFPHLYGREVDLVACDLHPDYASSRWAADSGLPVIRVQHHHAHAVACMAEHGLLDREVLAFTWDGTGLGTDGTV
jgi:hydrogenase maturation protein HypF